MGKIPIRNQTSNRMRLSLALIAAAYAADEERHFSDNVNDFLDDNMEWWDESWSPNAFMRKLENATKLVNNAYFGADSKVANRLNKFWSNLQGKMKRTGNRCLSDAHEINRRAASKQGVRGLLNDQELTGDAVDDFWTIFWGHGTWIREALLQTPECHNYRAMRMMRTLDRYRFITQWQYCDKVDDGHASCEWIHKWAWGPNEGQERGNPRSWNDFQEGGKYHRDGPQ